MDKKIKETLTIEGDDSWKWKEFDITIADLQSAQVLLSEKDKRISSLESLLSEREREIEELKNRPRSHICTWCNKSLFEKPAGTSPTDEEANEIAEHILTCADNPLVKRIKELEEGIKKYLDTLFLSHADEEGKHYLFPYIEEEELYKLIEKKGDT